MRAAPVPTAVVRAAYWLILAVGLGMMLRLNMPGHLSVDSILALREGRLGIRETWNPAIFGWLLGVTDRIWPGGGLVVVLDGVLLFGAWGALALLRPRASWLAPLVAAGAVALPQVLIYPAIVWKDVLFATTTVAGFVVLAVAARGGMNRPLPALAIAALLLAAAGLFRQNGLVLAPFAALAITAVAWRAGWRRALMLGAGWLAAVAALTFVLSAVAKPEGPGLPDRAGDRGVRILQSYDLVGAAVLDPQRRMPTIAGARPGLDDRIRAVAPRLYSPTRVDYLSRDPFFGDELGQLTPEDLRREWVRLITEDPVVYLRVRAEAFRWVLATPDIDRCLPIHLGVSGPAFALKDLGMAERLDRNDQRIFNYVTWFLDTPAMSHLAFAALALAVGVLLLIRRDPADLVMAALLAGTLVFTATFLLISIACDYRYLYALDIAAVTGALYFLLDPRLRRGERA
ncbi:hypothetical protein [Phenylobacterium sp.]|uniref:hypothetical protein n=1 Tax=Phenylobacterium sp. TaxID=1871053 RepID=UPI002EDADD1C